MDMKGMTIDIWRPSGGDMVGYLRACEGDFFVPLSGQVRLEEYAEKICRFATTFVARKDGVVAGLICAYFNRPETGIAYITIVHTKKEFRGMRVASGLLDAVVAYAADHGFGAIDLQVSKQQTSAFRLYAGRGFSVLEEQPDGRCLMRKTII